jgi:hypothetical protein
MLEEVVRLFNVLNPSEPLSRHFHEYLRVLSQVSRSLHAQSMQFLWPTLTVFLAKRDKFFAQHYKTITYEKVRNKRKYGEEIQRNRFLSMTGTHDPPHRKGKREPNTLPPRRPPAAYVNLT